MNSRMLECFNRPTNFYGSTGNFASLIEFKSFSGRCRNLGRKLPNENQNEKEFALWWVEPSAKLECIGPLAAEETIGHSVRNSVSRFESKSPFAVDGNKEV